MRWLLIGTMLALMIALVVTWATLPPRTIRR